LRRWPKAGLYHRATGFAGRHLIALLPLGKKYRLRDVLSATSPPDERNIFSLDLRSERERCSRPSGWPLRNGLSIWPPYPMWLFLSRIKRTWRRMWWGLSIFRSPQEFARRPDSFCQLIRYLRLLPARGTEVRRPFRGRPVPPGQSYTLAVSMRRESSGRVTAAEGPTSSSCGPSPHRSGSERRIRLFGLGASGHPHRARLPGPVIRVGNLDIRRDFTDVATPSEAYMLLLQKGRKEVYNVCHDGSGLAGDPGYSSFFLLANRPGGEGPESSGRWTSPLLSAITGRSERKQGGSRRSRSEDAGRARRLLARSP
jgi:hypothetical protein